MALCSVHLRGIVRLRSPPFNPMSYFVILYPHLRRVITTRHFPSFKGRGLACITLYIPNVRPRWHGHQPPISSRLHYDMDSVPCPVLACGPHCLFLVGQPHIAIAIIQPIIN